LHGQGDGVDGTTADTLDDAGFLAAEFFAGLKGERDATGEAEAGEEDGEEKQFGFYGRRMRGWMTP
jgi:hypothetical protein